MRKRIEYLDIAKAMTIILMIIGHMSSGILRNFIYSFHMPLFFILIGYCYKERSLRNEFHRIYKRILRPYFTTGLFIMIVMVIIGYNDGDNCQYISIKWISSVLMGNSTKRLFNGYIKLYRYDMLF